jgi:hypothetical protein
VSTGQVVDVNAKASAQGVAGLVPQVGGVEPDGETNRSPELVQCCAATSEVVSRQQSNAKGSGAHDIDRRVACLHAIKTHAK